MKLGQFVHIRLIQDAYNFEADWKVKHNQNPEEYPLEMEQEDWYKAYDKYTFE